MRDSDLHAYVDGQLEPSRRVEVEAWLAEDEEATRRVEAYRSQNAALHILFDPVLREPPCTSHSELAEQLGARLASLRERSLWWTKPSWQRMAASIALVMAGLGAGWLGHGRMAAPVGVPAVERPSVLSFAEEAAQAHTFYAHSRFEVEMGGDDQEALNGWLSERLGRTVFAPDLGTMGYRLKGGRSLPTDSGAVAQYMYESSDANRLTLFVGSPHVRQQTAFSVVQRGDLASFYWAEGQLSYALVGRFDRERLMSIAQAVHQKLKSGPAPRQAKPEPQGNPDVRPSPNPSDPAPQPGPSKGGDQNRPKSS